MTEAAVIIEIRRRALSEEEELLTHYSTEELGGGWEFKIVRANTALFRDPRVMKQVCLEEGQNGWALVEKFDDYRLRFKRSAGDKSKVGSSNIDPYRTTYGMSSGALTVIILVSILAFVALVVGILVSIGH